MFRNRAENWSVSSYRSRKHDLRSIFHGDWSIAERHATSNMNILKGGARVIREHEIVTRAQATLLHERTPSSSCSNSNEKRSRFPCRMRVMDIWVEETRKRRTQFKCVPFECINYSFYGRIYPRIDLVRFPRRFRFIGSRIPFSKGVAAECAQFDCFVQPRWTPRSLRLLIICRLKAKRDGKRFLSHERFCRIFFFIW